MHLKCLFRFCPTLMPHWYELSVEARETSAPRPFRRSNHLFAIWGGLVLLVSKSRPLYRDLTPGLLAHPAGGGSGGRRRQAHRVQAHTSPHALLPRYIP